MSEQIINTPNPGAPKVDTRKEEINKVSLIFNQLGIYVVVVALIIIGMIVSKGTFFAASNIQSILEAVALIGMVSAGLIFITYSGNMTDMSIPLTMAVGGMMTVQTINFGFPVAMLIGILSGVVIGFINGFMIDCAFSFVHSFLRKFRSTETVTPWRLAASQAKRVSSAALSEMAGVMPDQWNQAAPSMIASKSKSFTSASAIAECARS